MSAGTAASGVVRSVAAELVRTRRSAAARLTLVGLVVCALSAAGRLVSSRSVSWEGLLYWHVLYVTGLSAVLTALLAALLERRDRRARSGGTGWRACGPAVQRGTRVTVLAGLALVTNLLVFLPYAPLGLALGLRDVPVGTLTVSAVTVWAAGLGWLALAAALARWVGPFPAVAAALVWQVAGAIQAESDRWWMLPWTWAVRPVLPLLRVHHNGVPLEPGSPVWQYPTWPTVLASLALAAVAVPLAVAGRNGARRSRVRRAGDPRTPFPPAGHRIHGGGAPARDAVATAAPGPRALRRASTLAALAGSLRRTGIVTLTAVAVGLLVLVAIVYPPSYVQGLFGYVLLPTGAAVLAVLAWQATEQAWRIVLPRATGPHRPSATLLTLLAAVVTAACVLTGGLLVVAGDDVAHAASRTLVAVPLGWAGVALTLWLHARFHVAVALVTTVLGGVTGVLFAGSELGASWLWLAGPSAWVVSAQGPARTAVATLVALVVAVLAGAAFLRTASRPPAGQADSS